MQKLDTYIVGSLKSNPCIYVSILRNLEKFVCYSFKKFVKYCKYILKPSGNISVKFKTKTTKMARYNLSWNPSTVLTLSMTLLSNYSRNRLWNYGVCFFFFLKKTWCVSCISCIVPFCRTFNSSLDLLLIELKYMVFCSFVAAAGVLFPVKWLVFSSVNRGAVSSPKGVARNHR